jgi:DNA-binding transcriptional LysR family regulator
MTALRPTLHQLRVFEAVARLGSYTRAAEELHLTQPTVSVQMRELAATVGLPLLETRGRQTAPTTVGEALLAAARGMFDHWSAFEMLVSQTRGLQRGRLRLAAVTTAEYFLPALLAPYARAHPGIEVQLVVENRDAIVRRLELDQDDLAVMMLPPEHLPLEAQPFMDNPLVALGPADHPFARGGRITLAALAAEGLLVRERGSGTRMATEEHLERHGLRLRTRMELGSNEAIKHAVAAGLGLAVLSAHTLGPDPSLEGLAVLPVEGLPIRREWRLVHRAGRVLSPAAQAFLAAVRAAAPSPRAPAAAAARPARPVRARSGP